VSLLLIQGGDEFGGSPMGLSPCHVLKWVAGSALLWLLVLSGFCWHLAYGSEDEKAKSEPRLLVPLMLVFAWSCTLGVVLWEWFKRWLFG